MNIKEFSHNLQKLYQEMSESFSDYQNSTGWTCISSCGRCCTNPEIEASPYEMIPMALKIYEEGKLEEWMERLENSTQDHCLIYQQGEKEGKGKCSRYQERPSICRMFGVAGFYNKQQLTLSICKYIREEHKIQNMPVNLKPEETPIIVDWTYKLASLDPELIQNKMPVNGALYKALQKVALYAQYQVFDTNN